MLEVKELACARGEVQLFAGLSFALDSGEIIQVQGENGSGKTTLLRTLCGFNQAVTGEIKWRGVEISRAEEEFHADIIYLGHLNAIKDEFSALENLHISCAMSGWEVSNGEAMTALARMGLRGRETFPVRVLSQGQRRRVALARLLISKASLWVLDEPLTALDVGAVVLVQSIIKLHLINGGMVIFTTHQVLDIPEVEIRRLNLS